MPLKTLESYSEFEPNKEIEKYETELKFKVIDPEQFEYFANEYEPTSIRQIYLSEPSEPYSLRLRETSSQSGTSYTATLKSRGEITENGLKRLETPTEISKESFDYFASSNKYPEIRKTRVEPVPGVSIDWIDGIEYPIVEIEDININQEANLFFQEFRGMLEDSTGHESTSNERLAYELSKIGKESEKSLDIDYIFGEVLASHSTGKKQSVITISGRSGSGKTTVSNQLVENLRRYLPEVRIELLSTDDYNFGLTRLETEHGKKWTDWDTPLTYNTRALAFDVWQLQRDIPVDRLQYNFNSQEPETVGEILPADIILIEGIHAGSKDLDIVRSMHFDIGTPLATCIGRDLNRIRNGNRQSGSINTPQTRLRYQLEVAESTYQSLSKPKRNSWSASTRPQIGKTATRSVNYPGLNQ